MNKTVKVKRNLSLVVGACLVSAWVQLPAMAKEAEQAQSIPEQIEELMKISKLVSLEAAIAREQAKREKAVAEIKKARARTAWARVEKYKAEMKLKYLKESPEACCKEESDSKSDGQRKKKQKSE